MQRRDPRPRRPRRRAPAATASTASQPTTATSLTVNQRAWQLHLENLRLQKRDRRCSEKSSTGNARRAETWRTRAHQQHPTPETMTRRISKHGTLYTEGSSSTPTLDMPRHLRRCLRATDLHEPAIVPASCRPSQRHTNQAWHTCHCKGALTMETEPTTPTEPEADVTPPQTTAAKRATTSEIDHTHDRRHRTRGHRRVQ